MVADCLVCQEIAGELPVPGGLVWQDELAVAFHVPPLPARGDPYLGHFLVVTRRHVAGLAELSDGEGAAVGRGAALLARALAAGSGATLVHSAVAGTNAPHFHQHLLPRYPETPPDVAWHAVDEWDGARHADAAAIIELTERVKAAL